MSDDEEEEYEYDYGSDEEACGSDNEAGGGGGEDGEDSGMQDEAIELENSYYEGDDLKTEDPARAIVLFEKVGIDGIVNSRQFSAAQRAYLLCAAALSSITCACGFGDMGAASTPQPESSACGFLNCHLVLG
jgi:hypothetical protein